MTPTSGKERRAAYVGKKKKKAAEKHSENAEQALDVLEHVIVSFRSVGAQTPGICTETDFSGKGVWDFERGRTQTLGGTSTQKAQARQGPSHGGPARKAGGGHHPVRVEGWRRLYTSGKYAVILLGAE